MMAMTSLLRGNCGHQEGLGSSDRAMFVRRNHSRKEQALIIVSNGISSALREQTEVRPHP